LGSSQFSLLLQQPEKKLLTSKGVISDTKSNYLAPLSKSWIPLVIFGRFTLSRFKDHLMKLIGSLSRTKVETKT